jgi:hypothetical protein
MIRDVPCCINWIQEHNHGKVRMKLIQNLYTSYCVFYGKEAVQ